MKVCIAEKPSVALEIAKVLGARTRKDGYFEGNGYQVTWTFGHLCELQSPDAYDKKWSKWSLSTLPIIPKGFSIQLIKHKGIKKQFTVIKKLFSKAEEIINCGDAGQEGEVIQRWVQQLAGIHCPVKRLWISSLTEDSIRTGFTHLLPQSHYDSLYMAGLARAEGDWLMGMNLTRLYTLKYAPKDHLYSIGRVQTPTLAMIAARDKEIKNFVPKPYWTITTKYKGIEFTPTKGKFDTKTEAERVLASLKNRNIRINKIKTTDKHEQPPQLYDLTSLQVDLNNKYGYSASESLSLIQSLYEKKVSTYPRVDTRYLTDDIYPKCRQILQSLKPYKDITEYLINKPLSKSKRIFDGSKVSDHHAIIPTGKTATLTDKENKVFGLIARRFIAVFMPDSIIEEKEIEASCAGITLKATSSHTKQQGWKDVYPVKADESQTENHPDINPGDEGPHTPVIRQKKTTPPKPYTEATLLRAMETAGRTIEDEKIREAMKDNGIGRPSSRASITETLIKRGYVSRKDKALAATTEGIRLISHIKYPLLKSPETTGVWERHLREIEKGKFTKDLFIKELESQIRKIITEETTSKHQ